MNCTCNTLWNFIATSINRTYTEWIITLILKDDDLYVVEDMLNYQKQLS